MEFAEHWVADAVRAEDDVPTDRQERPVVDGLLRRALLSARRTRGCTAIGIRTMRAARGTSGGARLRRPAETDGLGSRRQRAGRQVARRVLLVVDARRRRAHRESTRSSAMSGPVSGNSRVPWPTTTGTMSRFISSTRSFSSSHRVSAPLPWTCSSPAGLAFSSPMAAATSTERTVVSGRSADISPRPGAHTVGFRSAPAGRSLP
jgi:hypothetical protein